MEEFLFFFSLETGALIIGIVEIFISLLWLLSALVVSGMDIRPDIRKVSPTVQDSDIVIVIRIAKVITYIMFFVGATGFIIGCLLVWGSGQNNHVYILPWFVYNTISMVVYTSGAVNACIAGAVVVALVIGLFPVLVRLYCCLALISLYTKYTGC